MNMIMLCIFSVSLSTVVVIYVYIKLHLRRKFQRASRTKNNQNVFICCFFCLMLFNIASHSTVSPAAIQGLLWEVGCPIWWSTKELSYLHSFSSIFASVKIEKVFIEIKKFEYFDSSPTVPQSFASNCNNVFFFKKSGVFIFRAGHPTTLPRQRDHVCRLLHFYYIRCGFTI